MAFESMKFSEQVQSGVSHCIGEKPLSRLRRFNVVKVLRSAMLIGVSLVAGTDHWKEEGFNLTKYLLTLCLLAVKKK